MKTGEEIGLCDVNGKEIKIGDCVTLATWWNTIGDIWDENVVAEVIWKDCAVMVRRIGDADEYNREKFMSVYCKTPERIRVMELI